MVNTDMAPDWAADVPAPAATPAPAPTAAVAPPAPDWAAAPPPFDPNKHFDTAAAPAFDPNQPHQEAAPAPVTGTGNALTDIWPEEKRLAAETWEAVKGGLGPENTEQMLKESQGRPFWDITPSIKSGLRVGSALGSALAYPFQAVVGAPAKSLVGHPLASTEEALGTNIDHQKFQSLIDAGVPKDQALAQATETPQQTYERWRGNVDTALSAIKPRGAPVVSPQGVGWDWQRPPKPTAPVPPAAGPFGVTLSQGEETGDLAKRSAELRLRRANDPHAQRFFEQREGQLAEAPQAAAAALDAGNQVIANSPQTAADIVGSGLAQHQDVVDKLIQGSEQALNGMHEGIRTGLSLTGTVLAHDPMDAANIIQGSVANEAERMQQAKQAAYAALDASGTQFHPAAFNGAANKMRAIVEKTEKVDINPDSTPIANRVLDKLDSIVQDVTQKRDPDTGRILTNDPITPSALEDVRKRLNVFMGEAKASARMGKPSDAVAMRGIIDAWDALIEDRIVKGTVIAGNPLDALFQMRYARGLNTAYRNTFMPRGPGDTVGQAIQKILGRYEGSAATPEQLQGMLYSPTNPQSVQIAGRLKQMFGETSPEFGAVKQGLYSHITERPAGAEAWGPEKVADRIEQFTKGPGRSLAQAYFTPEEITRMQEFGTRLRSHAKGVELAENPFEGADFNAVFRRAINQDPKAVGQLEEALARLRSNSPQAAALRQGLFLRAVQPIEGVAQRGPKVIADQLASLLAATRNSSIYNAEHRGVIQDYAAMLRKLEAPKFLYEPSGPAVDRMKQSIERTVGQLIGYAIARHLPGGGLAMDLMGIKLGGEGASFLARRNVAKIRQQLPILSEQMDKYQKAYVAWQRHQNAGTQKFLGVATANLANELHGWGMDWTKLPLGLPGTAPAEENQQQQQPRAAGGGVQDQDTAVPFLSQDDLANPDIIPAHGDNPLRLRIHPDASVTPPALPDGSNGVGLGPPSGQVGKGLESASEGEISPIGEPTLLDQAREQYPILQGLDLGYTENLKPNAGYLEYYSPTETGDEENPRPAALPLGTPGLEVRRADTRPIDILGDAVSHQLINSDPKIKTYYNNFVSSLTPKQNVILRNQYQYAQKNEGEARPYADWLKASGLPGLFRGYAFQQWPKEFTDQAYSPEQRKMFDNMMSYLRGEKSSNSTTPLDPFGMGLTPAPGADTNPDFGNRTVNRLLGTGGEERYQLWPERMIRSGATLAGDVMSGKEPDYTGLRREDYTDIPVDADTKREGGFWPFNKLAPVAAQPQDALIGRTQDMAALAGGAGMSSAEEGAVGMAGGKLTSKLKEARRLNPDGTVSLYHVTPAENVASILQEGLIPGKQSASGQSWQAAHSKTGTYFHGDKDAALANAEMADDITGVPGSHTVIEARVPATEALKKVVPDEDVSLDRTYGPEALARGEAVALQGGVPKQYLQVLRSDTSRPGAALSALEHTQPFYSAVEHAIANAPQQKMHGSQWFNWLKNQPGIKQEELDWLGLKDNPDLQGLQTKQQMLEHVQGQGVGLKEVEKTGPNLDDNAVGEEADRVLRSWREKPPTSYRVTPEGHNRFHVEDDRGNIIAVTNTQAEGRSAGEQFLRELGTADEDGLFDYSAEVADNNLRLTQGRFSPTKYSDYQLPGGDNYRELLLTMPDATERIPWSREKGNRLRELEVKAQTSREYPNSRLSPAERTEYLQLNKEAEARDNAPDQYRSSHWDEPNVLAHLRMNDRDIPDVGKSLHLEELQSDWAQTGRKKGFTNPEIEARVAKFDEARKTLASKYGKSAIDQALLDRFPTDPTAAKELKAWVDEADLLRAQKSASGNTVPNMPFKQSWPDLLLKRAITKAAQEGKDAISWTPGEQQAARYDLSKQVDQVSYDPKMERLLVWGKGANQSGPIIDRAATPKELPNIIGKEAADKIINSPTKTMKDDSGEYNVLRGLDLKVGGEGMKSFYDKMLVDKANAIGKKFGAKVEWKSLDTPAKQSVAERELGLSSGAKDSIQVPVLRLTPQLKQQALARGMPLFSDTSKPGAALSGLEKQPTTLPDFVGTKYATGIHTVSAPLNLKVYRTGNLQDAGRGIFFGDSAESIAPYSSIHNDAPVKEYTVTPNKTLIAESPFQLHKELFNGKSFQDAVWLEDKKSGFKSSVLASREVESKMAAALKRKGYDALIYTKPPAPAQHEISIFNPKAISKSRAFGGSVKTQPDQQHIPRPVSHQQDDRQPKHLRGFAAGGRVDPTQIDRNPSEAQKKSGTYSKDHVHLHGLAITLEHAKGHTRSGVDKDGRKWTSILPCAYGYIRRVPKGADKDHLDVYLGPHTKAPHVFIIDQLDKDTKKFDEHKIGIGWGSKNQFIQTYKRSFSDGKGAARIGAVHSMTLSQFKQWLEHGDTTLPFKEPERKKLSHKFVGYEPIAAKPNKHCSVCVHYISEEHNGPACVIVASPIDPGAWCRRFRRKS